MNTFGRALALDAQNPRAMLLMAQMELGTAQFFGQGPEKACGMVQNSIKLFEQEESRQADATLTPVWGKDMAVKIAEQCP
jgi:Tfp pilus assembly protein PilF